MSNMRAESVSIVQLAQELVREQAAWSEERIKRAREEARTDEKAIVALLLLFFEMRGALQKQVGEGELIAQDLIRRAQQILEDYGYSMQDFTGQELTDDLRERLTFAGYRHHELENDIVSETLVPEIDKGDRVLCYSVVIGASADALTMSSQKDRNAKEE